MGQGWTKPYHIEHEGDKFVVRKDSDGTVMGRHDTREEAEAQIAAIHANEGKTVVLGESTQDQAGHFPSEDEMTNKDNQKKAAKADNAKINFGQLFGGKPKPVAVPMAPPPNAAPLISKRDQILADTRVLHELSWNYARQAQRLMQEVSSSVRGNAGASPSMGKIAQAAADALAAMNALLDKMSQTDRANAQQLQQIENRLKEMGVDPTRLKRVVMKSGKAVVPGLLAQAWRKAKKNASKLGDNPYTDKNHEMPSADTTKSDRPIRALIRGKKGYYISRSAVRSICPSCASLMETKGLLYLNIKGLEDKVFDAVKQDLGTSPEGFFTRCMSHDFGRQFSDKEAFCAWLHKRVTGQWPAED